MELVDIDLVFIGNSHRFIWGKSYPVYYISPEAIANRSNRVGW